MGIRRYFRRTLWDTGRASEIDAYLAMETAENLASGMTPEEARQAAQRKFGSTAQVREEIYRMNSLGLLENFGRDLAYAVRSLRKSPGFPAVAVISLALGIGANTPIFGLVDMLMLRPLPVVRPHELARLTMSPGDPGAVMYVRIPQVSGVLGILGLLPAAVGALRNDGLHHIAAHQRDGHPDGARRATSYGWSCARAPCLYWRVSRLERQSRSRPRDGSKAYFSV